MNDTGDPRPLLRQTLEVKPKILVELRPCSEGFAGIPQETRLLYSILSELPEFQVGGLVNPIHDLILPRSVRKTSCGNDESGSWSSKSLLKQSRLVWALESEIEGVRECSRLSKWWRSLQTRLSCRVRMVPA